MSTTMAINHCTKRSMALTWKSSKSVPPKKRLRSIKIFEKPSEYVSNILETNGYDIDDIVARTERQFLKPSQEMIDGYTSDVLFAVRENNLQKIKEFYRSGKNMQCCNKFGESVIHLACRRGYTSIVKFLLEEAKVSLRIRDDQHRTPMHDACWTVTPNFELLEILIKEVPEHLIMPDIRGFTPFDYVRQSHMSSCVDFLSERSQILRPNLAAN